MRSNLFWLGGLAILAGCGGEDAGGGDTGLKADAAGPASTAGAYAPAAQARQASARPEIDCRTAKGQTAPAGQPADDILGIREGMTAGQVRAVLTCKNPDYVIEERTDRIGLPDDGQASEVTITADSGLDKVMVSLIGPMGRERVVHTTRTVEYVEGSGLPVAAIQRELTSKYGSFDQRDGGSRTDGYIIHARGGQRIGESNTLYGQCRLQPSYHGSWQSAPTSKCGEIIRYQIEPNRNNENVAFRFSVGVTDFAAASRLIAQSGQAAEQEKAAVLKRAQESAGRGLEL
jgi:hypothetical protein